MRVGLQKSTPPRCGAGPQQGYELVLLDSDESVGATIRSLEARHVIENIDRQHVSRKVNSSMTLIFFLVVVEVLVAINVPRVTVEVKVLDSSFQTP